MTYVKQSLWRKSHRKFQDSPISDKTTKLWLVEKFSENGCVGQKKKLRGRKKKRMACFNWAKIKQNSCWIRGQSLKVTVLFNTTVSRLSHKTAYNKGNSLYFTRFWKHIMSAASTGGMWLFRVPNINNR